jgi:hypothetical protein
MWSFLFLSPLRWLMQYEVAGGPVKLEKVDILVSIGQAHMLNKAYPAMAAVLYVGDGGEKESKTQRY